MAKDSKIRVRLAPSPTGVLHIGTARTALFNYLFAKQKKGSFILRVEDTDKKRSKEKYKKDIIENLKWLGLEWDEIYNQSKRINIYEKYLKKLLKEKKAYKDKIIWFKNPNKTIVFNDLIRGEVKFDSSVFGDFSLAKSLKEPLYNLANIIDDYEMKISHVIRGEDHISNTPKQILLYEALELPIPKFAHLPLILGPDKSKLSKRHGAVSVGDYKEQGYLAKALINFMALLGWSAQGRSASGGNPREEEIFSLEQLIKKFSLDKVQKGGAVFNIQKLNWYNNYYIRQMPIEELIKFCLPYLKKNKLINTKTDYVYRQASNEKLEKIIKLEQERIDKLSEIGDNVEFFFKEPKYKKELLKWKDMKKDTLSQSLNLSQSILCDIKEKDFRKEKIENILIKKADEFGNKDKGKLLWPLRVALTGRKRSPGPFEVADILGKKESLKRIKKAINLIMPIGRQVK